MREDATAYQVAASPPRPLRSYAAIIRAKLSPHDAYALCSIAVSFRVTQVVDVARGVHAMIPKSLFSGELRQQIAVV